MTKQEMAELMQEHATHELEIVTYHAGSDDPEHPEEYQLECVDCSECLFGFTNAGADARPNFFRSSDEPEY